MNPVPILSGVPPVPEMVPKGQMWPRAPEGRAATDLLMADLSAVLGQIASPAPGDATDQPDQPDQDQPVMPFLELFQAAGAQAPQAILPPTEITRLPENFKGEFVAAELAEIKGGIPFKTPPVPTLALAGVEDVAALPPVKALAPAQPPAPFSEPQTATILQRATDTPNQLQAVERPPAGVTSSVDAAIVPIEKVAPGAINTAHAAPSADTASKIAVVTPTTVTPAPTAPENLAPVALPPGKPAIQNTGVEMLPPGALQNAPRDLTGVPARAPLALGEVKETGKIEPQKAENPPTDIRGRLVSQLSTPPASAVLAADKLAASPILMASPSGPELPAPKVETQTPSLPVPELQTTQKTAVQNPNPNPGPNPGPRETGSNLISPPKVQTSVSLLANGQTQPVIPPLAIAPQISQPQPQHRAPEARAGQPQARAAPETPGAAALTPTNSPVPQPLIAEPLPPAFVDPTQLDQPLQPLAKSDGSPSLNALQSPLGAPKNIAIQIAQAALSDGGRSVEIALDPVELGKVRLTLHTSETGINVQFLADRPETMDLMRRNAHLLEAEFENLGYQNIGFDFSQNQQSATSESPEEQPNGLGEREPQIDDIPAVQPNYAMAPPIGNGLDLRL
ncbi:MAG: hypothetical protein GXP03_03155 [Alphaproteobacteria bacterium]|nr:hypothetical protein [Alphaproteobacteria bacterium]